MLTIRRLFAFSAFLLLHPSVMAQASRAPNVENTPKETTIYLTVTAQEEVEADRVRLTLSKHLTGKNQHALTEALNKAMNVVIEKAKADTALTVANGEYGFWSAGEKGKDILWEMRGEVIVTTQDFEKARAFIADTKAYMTLDGIRFYLSNEAKQKVEEQLIIKAAEAFRDKAQATTKAFGYDNYRIENVRLGVNVGQDARMLRTADLAASGQSYATDAVALSSGKMTVTVSADGAIALR